MSLPNRLQQMVDNPEGVDETNDVHAFPFLIHRGYSPRIAEQVVLYAVLRMAFIDKDAIIESARELGFDTELLLMPEGEA
jgi:hypothetical protein